MNKTEKFHTKKQFNKLLQKISRGEKDAFEEFYNVYGRFIFAKSMTFVKNINLADEIVNEVLLKVWRVASITKNIDNPLGWVYTITVNTAKDKLRAEKKYREIFDMSYSDDNFERVIANDAFYSKIDCLTEQEKDVLICKLVQKMSFKAIGAMYKAPISTVSSVYYRALKKINSEEI